MTCRELADLLIDLFSGDLPHEFRAQIEHHLKKCPPCVAYIKTYELTIRWTKKLPCQPLPPELEKRLKAAVERCLSEMSDAKDA